MKRGKRRWMVLIGLIGSALLVLRSARDPLENVIAGDLEYSNQWGWINWRHARDTGVAAFWKELNTRMAHAGAEPLTINYRQQMSGKYGPVRITSWLERTYRITPEVSTDRTAVAWKIFQETSEAFESMQGSLPSSLDKSSSNSSFRSGDLAGNFFAFQTAVLNLDKAVLKQKLELQGNAASLSRFKEHWVAQDRNWPVGIRELEQPVSCQFVSESTGCFRMSLE